MRSEATDVREWPKVSGSTLFSFITSGSRGWAKYYANTGSIFVRIGNLNRNSINLDLTDVQRVEPPKGAEGERTRVRPGDLLISITADLGMVAVAPESIEKAFVNQHVAIARPIPVAEPKYLAWFLASDSNGQRQLQLLRRGATKAGLGLNDIRSIQFPMPGIAEQRRIVAKLEELFSELDAGVAALRRAQRRLTRYRQSLLHAAVTGELTREWREQHADGIKPRKILPGDKYPATWSVVRVEQLTTEPACNGLSIKESTLPTEVRALRLNAMTARGFNYAEHRYLPTSWERVDDLTIREGDFFVSRGNGSLHLVGRSVLAQAPPFPVIFPDTMIRLRLRDGLAIWVNAIWPSRIVRSQIEASVKTTAGIWKISQGQLRSIEIPLPPPMEREAILAELDRRLSAVEVMESTIQASLRRAERLRQSILERAFRGELVPQDPRDEPATVMLDKMRSKAAPPAPARRGRPRKEVRV